MNYENFIKEIKEQVLSYLPESYEKSNVAINHVIKNNGIAIDGLSILKPNQNICPTIYLNDFFIDYEAGASMPDVLREISEIRMKHDTSAPFDTDFLEDVENTRNKIVFRVIGVDANKVMLQNCPHVVINDMAYTYHIMFDATLDGTTSARVTNGLLSHLNLDEKSIHQLALENTPKLLPAAFKSMKDTMREIMGEEDFSNMGMFMGFDEGPNLYVLTNLQKQQGAAALFYPGQMEIIKEKLKSDFYVLPSSIHEVLITPKIKGISYLELQEMVQEVNAEGVDADEVLTNKVYFYDGVNKELVLAEEYENQNNVEKKPQSSSIFEKMIKEQFQVPDNDLGHEM